ncbi:hypothetical protein B0H17DRAFT_1210397 [Mycena rosella]|uniref:Uncharacterized protein n=1 Tax=Mycena rosella TaxID=1033263 RepID=A0AAD7CWF0_MYCRO|nr:hypothetical protein B0H17DRAFT_1210397 [Mycena rosella]
MSYPDYFVWTRQANHIFTRLCITSNYDSYVLIDYIPLRLVLRAHSQDPPDGYLFVCPAEDLQIEPGSFRWPDCPPYWSLDPSGTVRLTAEKAFALGFPTTQVTMRVRGRSWDASVYAGLRIFHQDKGFDLDSQEVAKYLDYRLYKLSGEADTPFGHVYSGAFLDDSERADFEYPEVLAPFWQVLLLGKAALLFPPPSTNDIADSLRQPSTLHRQIESASLKHLRRPPFQLAPSLAPTLAPAPERFFG